MKRFPLTFAQFRMLGTLTRERQQFLAQNQAMIDELATMIASVNGLPVTETVSFFQESPDDPVFLVVLDEEEPE